MIQILLQKATQLWNRKECLNGTNSASTAHVYIMHVLHFVPPPGSVCWWGLPRRTPLSLALWRLGPSTTAPGPDTLTAADRYLLIIPVSNPKAFHFLHQNTFMTDLLGAPLGRIMFHRLLLCCYMERNKFTVIYGQTVRHMLNNVIVFYGQYCNITEMKFNKRSLL